MFFDGREADDRAADRIASLHFPTQAPKVLAQEQFWTSECLARYLGTASKFAEREPHQAREVAQIGVQLAQLVPPSSAQRQQLIRSLALLAWTHQTCGAPAQGEGIYRTAFELAAHAPLDPQISGDLLRRFASLLRGRGQFDSALEAATQAVTLLQASQEAHSLPADSSGCGHDWRLELGKALTERALVLLALQRLDDAVAEIGLALEALDPFRHEHEISACLELLARIAGGTRTLDRLHRVARRVAALREEVETHHLRPGTATARLAAKILRLDGRLFHRMGALQRAERSLRHARRLLRDHTDDGELLAVSLDLARLLAAEDRQPELRRLSSDTLEQVADRGGLSLTRYRWRRALASGRLDAEEIDRIRNAFDEERDALHVRIVEEPPAPASAQPPSDTEARLRPVAVGQ